MLNLIPSSYKTVPLVIGCVCLFFTNMAIAADQDNLSFGQKIAHDYSNFYSKKHMLQLGVVFLAGDAFANSGADESIQDWYRDTIKSHESSEFSRSAKVFGEKKYLVPLSFLASSAYFIDSDSAVGAWGQNTARAYIVGAPATFLLQTITGGSRPNETDRGSEWRSFNDSNGVSGHAFVGATPFLTLARMNEHNKAIKYSAFVASTFTALSRIDSDSHYVSQAVLGWYIAYDAVNSVFDTDHEGNNISITPVIGNDEVGVSIGVTW